MQTSDKKFTEIGADEFPFYTNEEPSVFRVKNEFKLEQNAEYLSGYRLSRTSAPSPNTIVPIGTDGKFPSSVLPGTSVALSGIIYDRAGLIQYRLVVEADGALSIDVV